MADTFDDLISQLAEAGQAPAGQQAVRDFTAACQRLDNDPREKQRIHDITDLLEAEDVIYDQALAAVERKDPAAALPLLRRCAAAGIGDSVSLLAAVLEELGNDEGEDRG